MALATPTLSFQDGAANAAVNLAANATAFVTPGNTLILALQSTTGVVFADIVIVSGAPMGPLDGMRFRWYPGSANSFPVVLPQTPFQFTVFTEVSDGNNTTNNANTFFNYQKVAGTGHRARVVSTANVASLAAYAGVTGGSAVDGVTAVQGDFVLLVGQSTPAQNGLYVVGVVAAGTAPLTRPADYATGQVFGIAQPQVCDIGPEGTIWANSTWKVTTLGPVTIDTTSHAWFPKTQKGQGNTGAGTTIALTTLWTIAASGANGPVITANDNTAVAAVQVGAIVAGAGTGTCTLTGTTAHAISWALNNW